MANPRGNNQNSNQAQKPVATFKRWPVRITVWENTGDNGKYYSTKFDKSYKDGTDYKNTDYFNPDDTLKLGHLIVELNMWIGCQE